MEPKERGDLVGGEELLVRFHAGTVASWRITSSERKGCQTSSTRCGL